MPRGPAQPREITRAVGSPSGAGDVPGNIARSSETRWRSHELFVRAEVGHLECVRAMSLFHAGNEPICL